MDTISVFDGKTVAKIQTCQRWMLEYEVKYLLLKLATVNAIIFKRKGNHTAIINYTIEKGG